ncbi:MAG: PilZ domain-containing protein [Armatimonadetes bacterium]|nr:PilZ domain-containing protein [Armatimonadota bacterium]
MFGSRKPVADLMSSEQVLLDIGGDRASDFIPTRVYSSDGSRIRIEAPRRAEDAVLFRPGVMVNVRYLRGAEMGIFRAAIDDMETAPDGRRILVALQPERVRWTQDIPEPQKRQFIRLDVDLEVAWAVAEGEFGEARAVELSGGGMILELSKALEVGTDLELDFHVEGHAIHTEAKVVRSRPSGDRFNVAVGYVRMDPTDEDAIALHPRVAMVRAAPEPGIG